MDRDRAGPGRLGRRRSTGAQPDRSKPFVECNSEELTHAVPELAGMQFDFNQDRLDGLLAATGEGLASMFARLLDIAVTEKIHEMRFEDGRGETSRKEAYRYLVRPFAGLL